MGQLERIVRLSPETLHELIKVHEQMLDDFSGLRDEIIKRTEIEVPKFDFTDGMPWKVAQDEVPAEELLQWKRPKKLTALKEIDKILKALGKGLSKYAELLNEGEHEEAALEKAAFYAEGVLEAYGVELEGVSDILRTLEELLGKIAKK